MRPIIDGKIPTSDQMIEAYKICNLADGPEKERAKAAWVKRHKFSRWPHRFFSGNPDTRDRCEKKNGSAGNVLDHPGHYLIEPLS